MGHTKKRNGHVATLEPPETETGARRTDEKAITRKVPIAEIKPHAPRRPAWIPRGLYIDPRLRKRAVVTFPYPMAAKNGAQPAGTIEFSIYPEYESTEAKSSSKPVTHSGTYSESEPYQTTCLTCRVQVVLGSVEIVENELGNLNWQATFSQPQGGNGLLANQAPLDFGANGIATVNLPVYEGAGGYSGVGCPISVLPLTVTATGTNPANGDVASGSTDAFISLECKEDWVSFEVVAVEPLTGRKAKLWFRFYVQTV